MSLWRSTFIVSFMTLLSRILGMVRDVVLMNVFGAGGVMDAFLVAFRIPNFFRRLFAEGAFANAFVPVLSEYKTQKPLVAVQQLVAKASGSLLLILSGITAAGVIFATPVIYLFAPGFSTDIHKFELCVELLRLTFPYLLLMSLTAFAGSVLQTYGRFVSASFAPVLLNVTLIAAAWWVAPMLAEPIMALGFAVVIAGILQLAIQVPSLWREKMLMPPKVDFKHEGVRQILTLMIPALFGVSVVQINLLLNSIWASTMQDGSVSWLYTAERLTELPLGLIGIAISSVILPSLSQTHALQDEVQFKRTLDWAARVICLVGLPASLAMGFLAQPIINVLYFHSGGQFTLNDVAQSAYALQAMSLSVLAFMLIKIFAPGFYARKDTATPVRIGLISVAVNIVLNVILIPLFRWQGDSPHVALAISSSVAACVNALLLYVFLVKKQIYKFNAAWRVIALRYAGANGAMMMALWLLLPLLFQADAAWVARIVGLVFLCGAGGLVYFIILFALGFRLSHIRM